jgi:hypothetical protein
VESKPIEAAFSFGEFCESEQAILANIPDRWSARITWKCPVDGRRNCELIRGEGCVKAAIPVKVKCKHGHETLVMPYRWPESQARCGHDPETQQ